LAILKIIKGARLGATFRLGSRNLTIGRAPTNLIQLVDNRVSRRHAMIRWNNGEYRICDLRSANGLEVNGQKTGEAQLRPGDVIKAGDTQLQVLAQEAQGMDGVLERKVVDPMVVNHATMVTGGMSDVEQLLAKGITVPVDDVGRMRDVLVHKLYLELGLALSKRDRKKAFERSVSGLVDFILPDRCMLLRLKDSKVSVIARYIGERVAEEHKATPPYIQGLRPVVIDRKAYLFNELQDVAAQLTPLGAVAAAPILNADEKPVALIYVDSFGGNCQPFIDEDLEVLEGVAKALRPAFDKSE
jgi:pSer/pThr/pTyr-binding forkhead associated (FHA) protein